jgi:hypothetical protein
MDDDAKQALFDNFNLLDGKIFALQRALREMINRDPNPDAARAAVNADLDGMIALSTATIISKERKASYREVQAHLIAKGDPS